MLVHCSNPTCAATIQIDLYPGAGYLRAFEAAGWAIVRMVDDDAFDTEPYCPRCKDDA